MYERTDRVRALHEGAAGATVADVRSGHHHAAHRKQQAALRLTAETER